MCTDWGEGKLGVGDGDGLCMGISGGGGGGRTMDGAIGGLVVSS